MCCKNILLILLFQAKNQLGRASSLNTLETFRCNGVGNLEFGRQVRCDQVTVPLIAPPLDRDVNHGKPVSAITRGGDKVPPPRMETYRQQTSGLIRRLDSLLGGRVGGGGGGRGAGRSGLRARNVVLQLLVELVRRMQSDEKVLPKPFGCHG